MSITFDNPLFLLLLVCLPFLWAIGVLAQVSGGRRWGWEALRVLGSDTRILITLVLRMLLLIALILSLSGMRIVRAVSATTVVFLIDGSDSVSPQQRAWAMQYINASLAAQRPDDRAAVVVFGRHALVERVPSHFTTLSHLSSVLVGSRTNIAEAIQLGLALFPSDTQKRLVLLSDGEENLNQAREAARLAALRGIPLDVIPLPQEVGTDVLIRALDAPARAHQGQMLTLQAHLYSTITTRGQLQFFADGELVDTLDLEIPVGPQTISLSIENNRSGFHRYEVRLEAEGDAQPINNRAAAFTMVEGPPRILLIATDPARADALYRVFQAAGAQVEIVPPDRAPADQVALKTYTAVVLVDVLAHDVPRAVKEALPIYVREQGGSLMMVGGHTSFGAGGWRRSAIADVLPVKLEREDSVQRPDIGLVLVVDRSGSMAEHGGSGLSKVDLAKEAIYQATLGLERYDQIGIVVFDTVANWVLPVQKLPDLWTIQHALSQFTADGGTDIRSGIEPAARALETLDAKVRHVILLTDGIAESNYTDLIDQMRNDGVTITVVSIGPDADPHLQNIAGRGGGRYYHIQAIEEVPRIFLSETVIAAQRDIEEHMFFPTISLLAPIVRDLERIPPLYGYNVTGTRPTARTILTSPEGHPILAQWQYGLGRSVAWTSDLKSQWGRDWISWKEFALFGSRLLDMLLPPEQHEGLELRTSVEHNRAIVDLTALPPAYSAHGPGTLHIEGRLLDPNDQGTSLHFEQVGAGRYRAVAEVETPGSYLVQVAVVGPEGQAGSLSSGLVVSYSPEYGQRKDHSNLLHDLATITGGRIAPTPDTIFTTPGQVVGTVENVSRTLLWIVILLLPLDIAVRRLLVRRGDFAALWEYLRNRLRFGFRPPPKQPTSEPDAYIARLFAAKTRASRMHTKQQRPKQ